MLKKLCVKSLFRFYTVYGLSLEKRFHYNSLKRKYGKKKINTFDEFIKSS